MFQNAKNKQVHDDGQIIHDVCHQPPLLALAVEPRALRVREQDPADVPAAVAEQPGERRRQRRCMLNFFLINWRQAYFLLYFRTSSPTPAPLSTASVARAFEMLETNACMVSQN